MILRLGEKDVRAKWPEIKELFVKWTPLRLLWANPGRWTTSLLFALVTGRAQLWLSWDAADEMRVENGLFLTVTEMEDLGQTGCLAVYGAAPMPNGSLSARHFEEASQAFSNFMDAHGLCRVEWYVNSGEMAAMLEGMKLRAGHIVYNPRFYVEGKADG